MDTNNGLDGTQSTPALSPRSKGPRPDLIRGALALRAAMEAACLDVPDLVEKLRPNFVSISPTTVQNWLSAESVPALPYREALFELLGLPLDTLLPDNETEVARAKRMISDKATRTKLANVAMGKRRANRWEKLSLPPAEATPAAPEPEPEPVEVAAEQDFISYKEFPRTGMAEFRLVLNWPHVDLEPLVELIRQELSARMTEVKP